MILRIFGYANNKFDLLKNIFFFLIIVFSFSCKSSIKEEKKDPKLEIENLQTNVDLKNYLLHLGELDQKYRAQVQETELKFGEQSKEARDLRNNILNTDEENMKSISILLETKGYPDVDDVGQRAASIPALIIHHYYHIPTKEKYFQLLKKAKMEGNISETDFLFYLSAIYSTRTKNDINLVDLKTDSQKIQMMMDSLKLN